MKVIAAYLLAVLGGKTCPTAEDIKSILGAGTFLLFYDSLSLDFCLAAPKFVAL